MYIQFVMGIQGGIPATVDNLVFLRTTAERLLEDSFTWSVAAAGKHPMPIAAVALAMGGNVRVGLEDNLYIRPRQLAKSNAEQVHAAATMAGILGREVAAPDEARAILGLKGGEPGQLLRKVQTPLEKYDWNDITGRLTRLLRPQTTPVGMKWVRTEEDRRAIPKVRIHDKHLPPCTIVSHAAQFNWDERVQGRKRPRQLLPGHQRHVCPRREVVLRQDVRERVGRQPGCSQGPQPGSGLCAAGVCGPGSLTPNRGTHRA